MSSKQARSARDGGIKQAVDHAEEETPGWSDRAYGMIEDYLTRGDVAHGRAFTAEDIRDHARILGLPTPPHLRSWGSVMRRAARDGIIRKVGIVESRAAHCHCSHVGAWQMVGHKGEP